MKKRFFSFPLMISTVIMLSACSGEDAAPENPAEDNSAIIFNPSVTYGTMTDQDGNKYKTISIGTQTWMAENLRTTKYNDGTDIPKETGNDEWGNVNTGAYCSYFNTSKADSIVAFGCLYNWYAVNTGKLAPIGWHVPTDAEWMTLATYLGGESLAGGKLKETGTRHWQNPNAGATNVTGFTALPGGYRSSSGIFTDMGYSGFWWSATAYSSFDAWNWYLVWSYEGIIRSTSYEKIGVSVRCVKD